HAVYAYGNSIEDKQMLSLADFSYLVGTDLSLPDLSNTSNQRQIS
ncbi:MAG TPA: HAD-IB family hydrolase, partial [Acinetobacter johnsonii]|nr:HAD-IB family hydrolase [Acinetobacter johnsonii]